MKPSNKSGKRMVGIRGIRKLLSRYPQAYGWHWRDSWVIYTGEYQNRPIGHPQSTHKEAWLSAVAAVQHELLNEP